MNPLADEAPTYIEPFWYIVIAVGLIFMYRHAMRNEK